MTIALTTPRSSRIEFDHLAQLTDSVAALTVDPLWNLFYYTVPFLGAWLTFHQELRPDDKLQAMKIDNVSKMAAITKVEKLCGIAGIIRKVTVYMSDHYFCSSYGGYCSLTSPIISIPKELITKPTQTRFEPEVKAKRRDIPQNLIIKAGLTPLNEMEEFQEWKKAKARNADVIPENPIGTDEWDFTADEALFFIAREVANIKSNNPFIQIVIKVIYATAIFFVFELALSAVVASTVIGSIVTLHIIAERLLCSQLDVDAVKLLEEYFHNEIKEGVVVQTAAERAFEAGKTAIEKLITYNIERREENELCRLYVTPQGNNLLNLIEPGLTARMNTLNEYKTPTRRVLHNVQTAIV